MSILGGMKRLGVSVTGNKLHFQNSILGYSSENVTGDDSTAQALSVQKQISFITTVASDAGFTLADGFIGQTKIIVAKDQSLADVVITPENFAQGTTITLGTTGYSCMLVFDGTNWHIAANNGGVVA